MKLEGGLQTRGFKKANSNHNPLISIITVVFNGEKVLEETIQSVLNQTYANVEFLIVDGGSTDQTLRKIEKYESKIDYWVSQKDSGIYDAMNKGIGLSSGQYINFMNCGDRFFSDSVLSDIFQNRPLNEDSAQIIFGDWEVRYPSGKRRIAQAGEAESLWKGSQFCHQSVFISSRYHRDHPYNDTYKIAADFEFFFSAFRSGVLFEKVNMVVSSIDAGGVSDTQRIKVIQSWWKIVGRGFRKDLYFLGRILREFMASLVKKILK